MTTKNAVAFYEVRWTVVVDHPELRSPTLPTVPAFHQIHCTKRFATQPAAVAFHDELLAGEYDFASEYVRCVDVARHYVAWRSPSTVRRVTPRVGKGRVDTKGAIVVEVDYSTVKSYRPAVVRYA